MDPLQLLVLLAIAGICGAFAQLAIAFDTHGIATVLVCVIVGIVGIFLANTVTEISGLATPFVVRVGAQRVDLILTILGAMLLLAALRLVQSGGRTLLGGKV